MGAPTTGYEPDPADVAEYLDALDDTAWGGDPLPAYLEATRAQVLHQAVAAAIADRRAELLARVHANGASYQTIADMVGLTRGRVQQLVERGRVAPEAPDGVA
jgi:DNA-directed RNA polymerase specialized sigma24 family protein